MIARAAAVAAVCLALAPSAGAAKGRLLVDPQRPVVGLGTLIEVQTRARAPLFVQLTSPTGIPARIRLTKIRPGIWRALYRFVDDGQWILHVPRANALAKVLVMQPGAAIPPFKTNFSSDTKASVLSGIAAPGIVIGR